MCSVVPSPTPKCFFPLAVALSTSLGHAIASWVKCLLRINNSCMHETILHNSIAMFCKYKHVLYIQHSICYMHALVQYALYSRTVQILEKHLKTDIALPWTSHGHIWDTLCSPVRECSTTARSMFVAESSTRPLYFCISWRRSFLSSASFLRRRWRSLLLSRKTWSTGILVCDCSTRKKKKRYRGAHSFWCSHCI